MPIVHKVSVGFLPQMKAESMTPMEEKSPCLINGTNSGFQNGVYFARQSISEYKESQQASALKARYYKDFTDVITNKTVRRLTPTECERLQGWPDGYTDVPLNGKPASDSARYKALGNGMAQPCARWIIQRIVDVQGGETDGD